MVSAPACILQVSPVILCLETAGRSPVLTSILQLCNSSPPHTHHQGGLGNSGTVVRLSTAPLRPQLVLRSVVDDGILLLEQRVVAGTVLEEPRIRKFWKPKQRRGQEVSQERRKSNNTKCEHAQHVEQSSDCLLHVFASRLWISLGLTGCLVRLDEEPTEAQTLMNSFDHSYCGTSLVNVSSYDRGRYHKIHDGRKRSGSGPPEGSSSSRTRQRFSMKIIQTRDGGTR